VVLLSEGLRIYEVVYNTKSEGKQNTNKKQKQKQIQKKYVSLAKFVEGSILVHNIPPVPPRSTRWQLACMIVLMDISKGPKSLCSALLKIFLNSCCVSVSLPNSSVFFLACVFHTLPHGAYGRRGDAQRTNQHDITSCTNYGDRMASSSLKTRSMLLVRETNTARRRGTLGIRASQLTMVHLALRAPWGTL
jgi:hypothetical protein